MATASPPPKREMKVLAMGLPRTGTASIAEALTTLGYKNVFHGLNSIDTPDDWKIINRAADASFPTLPSYRGKPFSRDEWDELLGSCEGTTDMTAMFGTTLTKVYPDAKVILVVRPFEKWWKSIEDAVIKNLWGTLADISVGYVEPIIGSEAGPASRKIFFGFFRAQNIDEVRLKARENYDRHYREMRESVPKEQLLEYRMGEGWGPICEFLGKPVPEKEFPWVNETAELKRRVVAKAKENLMSALTKLAPWVIGVSAVGIGAWKWTAS